MSEVTIGDVDKNGDFFAEVTMVDIQTPNRDGEWTAAVEFTAATGDVGSRYVLDEDVFLDTYERVGSADTGEYPPEATQMPADVKPPKPKLY
jgi:hypothetical protein